MGHKDHEPALTGQIQGLQSQHAGDARHLRRHRNGGPVQMDAHMALCGDFVQHSTHTAPGGIPDHMDVLHSCQRSLHRLPERRAVGADIRLDAVCIPRQQDGAAVTSHVARHDDVVSRPCQLTGGFCLRQQLAHAGGGDEESVTLSLAGHLGVAGHETDAHLLRGFLHGRGDFLQLVHGEALLDHEGTGHVQGPCAHAGQVVDGAADGKLADVSAREKGR